MNFANKLQTMVDAYCTVVFENENPPKETIDRSEFKVTLQSGDVVIVSGCQIIDTGHDYSKAV